LHRGHEWQLEKDSRNVKLPQCIAVCLVRPVGNKLVLSVTSV
jgi:hypothetical protein